MCVNFCCTASWPSHTCLCVYTYVCVYTHTHTHTHICTLLFSYYLPSCSIPRDWIWFPGLYSRTSWLIHSECNSLHLLTPNSQSIPFTLPAPWQSQVCSPCLWVCFCSVDRFICAIFSIAHITYKWCHMAFVFLFLTSLSMGISSSIQKFSLGSGVGWQLQLWLDPYSSD